MCKDGFYDDGTAVCKPCLYHCFTCDGPSSCKTCSSLANRVIVSLTNTCICKDGFYDTGLNAQTCQACHASCKTCIGSSTNCVSCTSSNHRSLVSLPGNLKSCPCDQYYYSLPEPLSDPICPQCQYSCSTCLVAT